MKKIAKKICISALIGTMAISLGACSSNNASSEDDGDRNITEETKSAYEQYKDANPGYSKSESEWLQDLLSGNLGAKKEYTITFNSNGGTDVEKEIVNQGEKIEEPSTPTNDYLSFEGWYSDAAFTKLWDFDLYSPTNNLTLYAKWGYVNYATYQYSSELDGYIVTNVDTPSKVVYIPYRYDDGIHGNLKVLKMNKGCLSNVPNVEKLVIPFTGESEDSSEFTKLCNLFGYDFEYWEDETDMSGIPSSLKTVELVSGATKVSHQAFCNMPYVEKVILPDTCEEIGSEAFLNCQSLKTVNYKNVKRIKANAFEKSTLESFEITSSVESIGEYAFSDCSNLSSITFPEDGKLKKLSTYLFANCTALTKVVVPNYIEEMEEGVFYFCKGIKELSLPFIGSRPITEENSKQYEESRSLSFLYNWTERGDITLKEFLESHSVDTENMYTSTNYKEYGRYYSDYYEGFGGMFEGVQKLTITGPQTYMPIACLSTMICIQDIYLPNITKIQSYGVFCGGNNPVVHITRDCIVEEWGISEGKNNIVYYD